MIQVSFWLQVLWIILCPYIELSSNFNSHVVRSVVVHLIQLRHICYCILQSMNDNTRNFWKTTWCWRRYRLMLGLENTRLRCEVILWALLLLGKATSKPYGWCLIWWTGDIYKAAEDFGDALSYKEWLEGCITVHVRREAWLNIDTKQQGGRSLCTTEVVSTAYALNTVFVVVNISCLW